MEEKEKVANHYERFVHTLIEQMQKDHGVRAKMRRADNLNTEYQAWEYLVRYGNVVLDNDRERKIFCTIGAAIAKADLAVDGKRGLGYVLRKACQGNDKSDDVDERANSKLQRLLTCNTAQEICDVLRTLLPFIEKEVPGSLSYAQLLKDLIYYNEKTRVSWASDFFYAKDKGDE